MQFFYWNESYEIGIPTIDEQHQQLVKLINNLGSALEMHVEMPRVKSFVSELRDYIDFHFRDEEKIMSQSSMPEDEIEEHKEIHRSFARKIDSVIGEKDLSDARAVQEIFDFLVAWLINHILGVDTSIPQYLSDSPTPAPMPDGSAYTDMGGNDITWTLIHALNESEKRFRLLSDNAPVLIWITDASGRRVFANKAWANMLGQDIKASSSVWFDRIHPKDRSGYEKHLEALLQKPCAADFEYRFKNLNGEYRNLLERSVPRLEERGSFMGLIASTVDITALKMAEELLMQTNEVLEAEVEKRTEEIRQLMLTDTLTQVKNRRFLMETLDAETLLSERYGSDLSLMFMDIDHFKSVNDEHGHLIGDKVLIHLAKVISEQLRDCDLLCRYGGEEFVVILPRSNLANAKVVAERVLGAIRNAVVEEIGEAITVSAGLGQWQKGEKSLDILERCDRALYSAKTSGRDQFCLAS